MNKSSSTSVRLHSTRQRSLFPLTNFLFIYLFAWMTGAGTRARWERNVKWPEVKSHHHDHTSILLFKSMEKSDNRKIKTLEGGGSVDASICHPFAAFYTLVFIRIHAAGANSILPLFRQVMILTTRVVCIYGFVYPRLFIDDDFHLAWLPPYSSNQLTC